MKIVTNDIQILLFLLVAVFCLTADEIEAQNSGWNVDPNAQYHIQTDEGPERYFRYQTLNGQYRKEKRLVDGTVIGTEGWIDPLGYLRLKDYIADHNGFRILKSKMVYVGPNRPMNEALAEAKKVPAQSGIAVRSRRPPNPFRKRPETEVIPLSDNELDGKSYPTITVRPRLDPPRVSTSRGNKYYYEPQIPSDSELQSLDTYSKSRYYPNESLRTPIRVLQAPIYSNDNSPYKKPIARTSSRRDPIQESDEFPPYDGVHTLNNSFQYYLKRQYHEEEREPTSDKRVGSFGYIDPFGIRRVIYYKTDPHSGGFVHKKNNRYVGFGSTPYDPSPPSNVLFNRRRRRGNQPSSSSST